MIIIHRCLDCGHPDVWASPGTTAGGARAGVPTPVGIRRRHCSAGIAPAGHQQRGAVGVSCHGNNGACTWGPPEASFREWRSADRSEITDVRQPGQLIRLGAVASMQPCDCDACKKLYRDLTGVDLYAA